MPSVKKFQRFTSAVIAYTIFVILWGAFVRATGSGAGCGDHWPLCNGEIIPQTDIMHTAIEFGHRVTSGFSLILVIAMAIMGFKLFEKGHNVRKAAVLSLVFILLEAGLGAGLVLFELVGSNDSVARAVVVCLHLLNTLGLLAALTWTAFSSRLEPYDLSLNLRLHRLTYQQIGIMVGLGLVTMAGGIVALGDTLFPAASLMEGLKADFDSSSHFLIRLRAIHPILAVATAMAIILFVERLRDQLVHPKVDQIGKWLSGTVLLQVFLGVLNVFLLAPIWMQLVHLALADVIWILTMTLFFQTNYILGYDETQLQGFLGEAHLVE